MLRCGVLLKIFGENGRFPVRNSIRYHEEHFSVCLFRDLKEHVFFFGQISINVLGETRVHGGES